MSEKEIVRPTPSQTRPTPSQTRPTLEITTCIGCRNNCVYCPQGKLIKAYAERSDIFVMTFDVYKKCLDKIPKYIDIEFSGMAEPFLNRECAEMILYAHQKGHRVSIYSTLIGLTLADFKKIKAVPFGRFWLHLPAAGNYESMKVDDQYLEVLQAVFVFLEKNREKINVSYHIRGENVHPKIKAVLGDKIEKRAVGSRAGNLDPGVAPKIKRRRGCIGCKRNLMQNVLLPNGDVALCCMDYGLKHILGNLLSSSYGSLFISEEFVKVQKGLKDEAADTICRYCDMLAYNKDWKAKIFNRLAPFN